MKKLTIIFAFLVLGTHSNFACSDSLMMQNIIALHQQQAHTSSEYRQALQEVRTAIFDLQCQQPRKKKHQLDKYKKLTSLYEKQRALENSYVFEISRVRFRKGIEIIKLLYEKILSLDHHFVALDMQQGISSMTNPHNYRAFKESQDKLSTNTDKGLSMPSFAGGNVVISTVSYLVESVFSNKKGKSEIDEEVACILDFTLRMNNDLNTIYYETEFLKNGTSTLLEEIETLFADYNKPVGYKIGISECRKSDDWESLTKALNDYMEVLIAKSKVPGNPSIEQEVFKLQADLEFSIDRLITFIDHYVAFIKEGGQYYEKFNIIVNSYENESTCAQELPVEFSSLKTAIMQSIERFNDAYNSAEIKGSKLKDLMYGS